MAHTVVALKAILKGLKKLIVNEEKIREDLNNNWAVVAEGIQTILRREGYPNPYEALKKLTRKDQAIDRDMIISFINNLDISEDVKEQLRSITPFNYTGFRYF